MRPSNQLLYVVDMVAQSEYAKLCLLIGGKHPVGDCQLVSLMIARAIDGDIINGIIVFKSGQKGWHYWVKTPDGYICDPLAGAWKEKPCFYGQKRCVKEEEILDELKIFVDSIDYIPPRYENPIFPLRYMLAEKLLGISIPGIENLIL